MRRCVQGLTLPNNALNNSHTPNATKKAFQNRRHTGSPNADTRSAQKLTKKVGKDITILWLSFYVDCANDAQPHRLFAQQSSVLYLDVRSKF
jgi:hypothetical protein